MKCKLYLRFWYNIDHAHNSVYDYSHLHLLIKSCLFILAWVSNHLASVFFGGAFVSASFSPGFLPLSPSAFSSLDLSDVWSAAVWTSGSDVDLSSTCSSFNLSAILSASTSDCALDVVFSASGCCSDGPFSCAVSLLVDPFSRC